MKRAFVGLDQTGAVKKPGGRPKPLPMAVILAAGDGADEKADSSLGPREGVLRISHAPSLSLSTFKNFDFFEDSSLEILVDCVLGLPKEVIRPDQFREQLKRAVRFQAKNGFGQKAAEAFFKESYPQVYKSTSLPQRECERRAAANSVFRARPYQKNIQTGTYRIWCELGQDLIDGQDWFWLWSHESPGDESKKRSHRRALGEGYPSHSWKTVTGLSRRDPKKLAEILKAKFPGLKQPKEMRGRGSSMTADQADAVVLAVHLWSKNGFAHMKAVGPGNRKTSEGWIFGVEV